ncbi:MAG: pacearchaeosortase [archaeon]
MTEKIWGILLRYVLASLSILVLPVIYLIFRPLTSYPLFGIIKIFYPATINSVTEIIIGSKIIEIIDPCIAGSAFLLLLILNLLISIKFEKRIGLLALSFGMLYLTNLIRLVILSFMFIQGSGAFEFVHTFFWFFISVILVAGIWILSAKIMKIKEIPFYSDMKYLKSLKKKTEKTNNTNSSKSN